MITSVARKVRVRHSKTTQHLSVGLERYNTQHLILNSDQLLQFDPYKYVNFDEGDFSHVQTSHIFLNEFQWVTD